MPSMLPVRISVTETVFRNCIAAIMAVSVTFVLFLSCSENPTQPPSDPYEKWQSLNAASYSIDQVHICYCRYGGDTLRLSVENDSIVRALRLRDNVTLDSDSHYAMATIDQLFTMIKDTTIDSIVIEPQ